MSLKERGLLVSRRGRTLRLGPFVVLQGEQDWLGLFGRLTLWGLVSRDLKTALI